MFNYPNVQLETVDCEIDRFIDDLKSDGFDFANVQDSGGKDSLTGDMRHYLGREEIRDSRN